jgi:hypothetical protein
LVGGVGEELHARGGLYLLPREHNSGHTQIKQWGTNYITLANSREDFNNFEVLPRSKMDHDLLMELHKASDKTFWGTETEKNKPEEGTRNGVKRFDEIQKSDPSFEPVFLPLLYPYSKVKHSISAATPAAKSILFLMFSTQTLDEKLQTISHNDEGKFLHDSKHHDGPVITWITSTPFLKQHAGLANSPLVWCFHFVAVEPPFLHVLNDKIMKEVGPTNSVTADGTKMFSA